MKSPKTEKNQVGIYQIEKAFFVEETFEDICGKIIKTANDKGGKYTPDRLLSNDKYSSYKMSIYYQTKDDVIPRWRNFLKRLLADEASIHNLKSITHSFLLFIEYKGVMYAITGGIGFFALDNFISQSFGMEILARLIKKNSQVIKHTQQRGVSGNLLGQTRFYRGDQRLSDEKEFGKIFKEVRASLDKDVLKKTFGFKEIELTNKGSGCLAKNSFQINKVVDIDELLRIITKLTDLLEKEPNFPINSVELIKGKNQEITSLLLGLEARLIDKLYEHYNNETECDFDLCHVQFDKYLTALSYFAYTNNIDEGIQLNGAISLTELFKKLKEKYDHEVKDVDFFRNFILKYQFIETQDDNGEFLTKDSVYNHIHGEIEYNGSSYFLIDKQWYRIKDAFVNNLNLSCNELLEDAWDDFLITAPFTHKVERHFNESFIGQDGTIVLDTITSDNIEACDILKYDNNSIHLIHVKQGFNNSIRDLAAQISIAARRISEDRKTGYEYLRAIERRAKRGKTSPNIYLQKVGNQVFPTGGLKSLFEQKRDSNICFCLAFLDTAKSNRSLKNNIVEYDSNIAKYALIELKNEVRQHGFDFKIIQLKSK